MGTAKNEEHSSDDDADKEKDSNRVSEDSIATDRSATTASSSTAASSRATTNVCELKGSGHRMPD